MGVDLAWSRNNHSGIVILENNECILAGVVKEDEEILRIIYDIIGNKPVRIAIDAPLTVPNETGSRVAEKELNEVFRVHEAGAHPANRSWFLQSSTCIRGEELVAEFEKRNIVHDPTLSSKRCCFEVYPHPATIRLFELEKTLKYKPRQNRSYEQRYEAFKTYQEHLKSLGIEGVESILANDVTLMKGRELKDYEDVLDAILCAYIAQDIDTRGSDMYGNTEDGYILVPRSL